MHWINTDNFFGFFAKPWKDNIVETYLLDQRSCLVTINSITAYKAFKVPVKVVLEQGH
jgi:hypothetical protein